MVSTPAADINGLRQLISATGPPPSAAAELLATANGNSLHNLLVACLHDGGAGPLTETEALSVIVRLLAVGTGDPTGDSVTADPLDPLAGGLERANRHHESEVCHALRSQHVVHAILELLERKAQEFERGESLLLRLEALRALRLVLTPEGLLYVGAPHNESSWWVEEDLGYLRNGDTRRRLVECLLRQLENTGDSMGQKPKLAALGSLWSLAAASSHIRTRVLQSGGEDMLASLFRAQVRQPPPLLEGPLTAECGVLAALAAGGRVHERQLAKLGVEQDVLEMLRRYKNHRQIVCAGLVFLALLANEESIAARLAASADALATVAAARARWPDEVEKAFKGNSHYISPTAAALLRGSAPCVKRRPSPRSRQSRHRPMRAAAVCVVGGARG